METCFLEVQLICPNHYFYQTCTNRGEFLTVWKASETVPIHRGGNVGQKQNYHQSTYLRMSQVNWKKVFDDLYEKIPSKIVNSQFGFSKNRSVVIELHRHPDYIYKPPNAAVEKLYVLYLDFKKSFHCFPHQNCSKNFLPWVSEAKPRGCYKVVSSKKTPIACQQLRLTAITSNKRSSPKF